MVAACNYIVEESLVDEYIQFVWYSADSDVLLRSASPTTNPHRPAIPSVIVTITQV